MPDDDWLANSRFDTARDRNAAVRDGLARRFDGRAQAQDRTDPNLDAEASALRDRLVAPLRQDPPVNSQAAEAAMVMLEFAIAEGRPLNLVDRSAGDLNDSGRLGGDRSVGDWFCENVLDARHIPATKGPFQSSSWRGGYSAGQVRDDSVRKFIAWASGEGRTLDELAALADSLADEFLAQASSLPAWPKLAASRFSFTVYRRARDELLGAGSGGALEQYLLAGLLVEELATGGTGLRVDTKSVGANDRSSGAAGDIELRQGHALRGALEVTAAEWDSKLAQLGTAADAGLTDAVVVAPNVIASVTGEEMAELVDPQNERLGLDVAVVDLHGLMDVAASRITAYGRASAFTFVYRCLVRWHRRQPELVHRLIDVVTGLGLVVDEDDPQELTGEDVELADVVGQVRAALAQHGLTAEPLVPEALRDLAAELDPPD